jgi:hypothetical protein
MQLVVASALVVALAGLAHANGRDPATSTINFRRGNDDYIVAGMTFGVASSTDGGTTWQWMCERAVGYGGQYDPDYVYTSTGAVFATTFDGLKVMRDSCSFNSTAPGMTFVSKVEQGSDGAIYYAAADMADSKIYKSTDDGMTFPTSANLGMPGDWWSSLMVAPSNAQRLYATGYRLDGVNPKVFLLKTSTNGGTSYVDMATAGINPLSPNSIIEVVGTSASVEQTLYIKVSFENGSTGDSIYRSTNAGQTWTKILTKSSDFGLAFLARKNGTCIAGTRELGAWVSTDCATAANPSWTTLTNAPHITCLYQNSGADVWACTQNYSSPQLPGDGFGIMKTSDLATWVGVLRFQDIAAPATCPVGTTQQDQCVQSEWCCLVQQLGLTSSAIDCTGAFACSSNPPADGVIDASTSTTPKRPDSCCGTTNGRSNAVLGLLVFVVLMARGSTGRSRRGP